MDSRNCLFASVRTTNKWVLVIALAGACMHAISAFATTFPPGITTTACVFFKALNLLIVLLYLSLIVADRKGIPRLYLPYLIIEAIGLICAALMLVIFAAIMVAAPQSWIDAYNKQYPESHMTVTKFRCILALADLSLVLGIALTGVCYTVIYCAYKHVKEGKQCDEKNQKLLT